MGKESRRKGATYECHVANIFKEFGWTTAKRHLEYQSDEAEAGRDLDGTQPFAIQVKCWKSTPSIQALLEIKTDAEYTIPLAVLKRTQSTGKPGLEVAVIPLDMFMRIVDLVGVAYHDIWHYVATGNEL